MNKMNKKGFTLIEMLVVIAIIAILVSIIVPVVGNSTAKAAAATNAANLRSAASSLAIMLMEDNDGLADGAVTLPADFTAPTMKAVNCTGAPTGGTFKATITNGQVICTFGDDGTIAAYSDIAEDGKVG